MKPTAISLILFIALLSSCKKDTVNINYNKLIGNHLGIGTVVGSFSINCPDVFIQYNITAADAKTIHLNGNVYTLSFEDKSINTIVYSYYPSGYSELYNHLEYNYAENSTIYTYGWGGRNFNRFTVLDSAYISNPFVKKYTEEIAGVKSLAGTVFDTFMIRKPTTDSVYSLATDITFSIVNDSTVSFDKELFYIEDKQLHYKYTDYSKRTVIYETLHDFEYRIARVTYNYETRKLVFEQWLKDFGIIKYCILD